QSLQVFIKDLMLFVCQLFETGKGFIELGFGIEFMAQLFKARPEGVPTGVLTKHDAVGMPADILSAHDLVSFTMLQYAILVNPGFMSEGVGPHNSLVGLNRKTSNGGYQTGSGHNMGGINASIQLEDRSEERRVGIERGSGRRAPQ